MGARILVAVRQRSKQAQRVLWLGIGIVAVLWLLAWLDFTFLHRIPHGGWTNSALFALIVWWLLLLSAIGVHLGDERRGWAGIYHLHRKTREDAAGESQPLAVIPNILARQAIHTGIALGVLAALASSTDDFFPFYKKAVPIGVAKIISDPVASFSSLIVLSLGFSIAATLVAGLCYDHAIRFGFRATVRPEETKRLRTTGRRLDTLGWYALVWALVGTTALADFRLCFAAALIVFTTVWFYYFFPEGGDLTARNLAPRQTSEPPAPSPTAAQLLGQAAATVHDAASELRATVESFKLAGDELEKAARALHPPGEGQG